MVSVDATSTTKQYPKHIDSDPIMPTQFTWIPLYQELATALSKWQNRQDELIAFLENLRAQGFVITALQDKDENGEKFLMSEIDPFTFFGVFNRGIKQEQRLGILREFQRFFGLTRPLPDDFDGIPILNNQSSRFFSTQDKRQVDDVLRLWTIFQEALADNPLSQSAFREAFDNALQVRKTNVNLTMGLFWIRPYTFLNLDSTNREYLEITLPKTGLTAQFYIDVVQSVAAQGKPFPELSRDAWLSSKSLSAPTKKQEAKPPVLSKDIGYWLVGAFWDDRDPQDQTDRFVDEGIWENGYRDRYLDDVRAMHVGDRIAIKAAFTQRKGLPFDAHNKTVSRMSIKAIGTIVANRNDGRSVEVDWAPNFQEKQWYFYTSRNTVWHLKTDPNYPHKALVDRLIDFVWGAKSQDYEWFSKYWWDTEEQATQSLPDPAVLAVPYSFEDLISSGVFLTEQELTQILDTLMSKKAIILQGPPGVGKTYIARKLAYALMKEIDPHRVEMVTFHQSYAYEDFVQGYRPSTDQAGRFELRNGVFFKFSDQARSDPDREYVFIIDEINRGNLSQIFGELLMLIEADKRNPESAVPLLYASLGDSRFFVPPNVYILGLMNVADRSLAMVDYALRRRFAFETLRPQYTGSLFREWLLARSMPAPLVDMIVKKISALNDKIRKDPLLGENYEIGHSFFCPKGDDFSKLDFEWYRRVVTKEIIPLLKEYWFDNPKEAEDASRSLLDL